jgi:hypothetical protein
VVTGVRFPTQHPRGRASLARWLGGGTRVLLAVLFATSFFASALCLGQNKRAAAPEHKEPDPVQIRQVSPDIWTAPVLFNGRTYLFQVDTGAAYDVVDVSLIGQLGESAGTVKANVVNASRPLELRKHGEMQIVGGPPLSEMPVGVADLSLSNDLGADIRGIIGMTTLRHYVWKFDSDARVLTVAASSAKLDASHYATAPLLRLGDSPAIVVHYGDRQWFAATLDTGMSGFMSMAQHDLDALQNAGRLTESRRTTRLLTLGGTSSHRSHVIPHLEAWGVRFENADVTGPTQGTYIGREFTRRFSMILDFRDGLFRWHAGKAAGEPLLDIPLGMVMQFRENRLVITHLRDDGPFDVSSLEVGDIITALAGHAGPVSIWAVRERLTRNGRAVLSIERKGRSLVATVSRKP